MSTTLVGATIVALAGVGAGEWTRRHVSAGAHRYEDEVDVPRRSTRWAPIAAGLAGALVWLAVDPGHGAAPAAVGVVTVWTLVHLSAIDADVHRLPDRITLPAAIIAPVLLAVCSLAAGDWDAWVRAMLAGLAAYALFWGLFFVSLVVPGGGFGMGDAKLAGPLAMLLGWFGWSVVVLGLYATFLVAGIWAAALLLTRRAGRRTDIAFGPFMAIGTTVALLLV